MNVRSILSTVLCVLALATLNANAGAWTYRGSLSEHGEPTNGSYDFRLTLLNAARTSPVSQALILDNVRVEDGQFAVEVDFGLNLDRAPVLHLKTEVRQEGDRFMVLGEPARFDPRGALNSVCWNTTGNVGTDDAVNFVGTVDTQPLVLRTANTPALRLWASDERLDGTPITANLIAGSAANSFVEGVRGATISGGGVTADGEMDTGLNHGPNQVHGHYGSIGGGVGNQTGPLPAATVSGGRNNAALASDATIGGGASNSASGSLSTIAGGHINLASGVYSFIGGGSQNRAIGNWSAIDAGLSNCAGGTLSWVGGRRAATRSGNGAIGAGCAGESSGDVDGDEGTFVWADSQDESFVSTGPNQFLIRSGGGMGINTNAPRATLTVTSEDRWNPTNGDGWGDFTVGTEQFGLGVGVSSSGGGAGTVRLWPRGGVETIRFTTPSIYPSSTLVINGNGLVGVGRNPVGNAFEVQGNASKLTAGDWLANSDARIKTDVQSVDHAVERLLQLRPVSFRYTDDYLERHSAIKDVTYYNVIAQEYAKVFPDAVQPSGEHLPGHPESGDQALLQVDFHPAVVTTVAAVQELAARLNQSEEENEQLRAALHRLDARLQTLEEAN